MANREAERREQPARLGGGEQRGCAASEVDRVDRARRRRPDLFFQALDIADASLGRGLAGVDGEVTVAALHRTERDVKVEAKQPVVGVLRERG